MEHFGKCGELSCLPGALVPFSVFQKALKEAIKVKDFSSCDGSNCCIC